MDEAIAALDCYGILHSRRVYDRLSIHSVRFGDNLLWVVGKRVRFQSTMRWLPIFPVPMRVRIDGTHIVRFPYSRSFSDENLPHRAYPEGFHGSQIPIDGAAVAKACVARLQA